MKSQRRYTHKMLVAEIQRVAKELGVTRLSAQLYRKHAVIPDKTVLQYFGTWHRAMEAAGLPPVYPRCGPEQILRKPGWVSKTALHWRVYQERGSPMHCEECGTSDPNKGYDWANTTGNYLDVNDFRRLCRTCHMASDGRLERLRALERLPPQPAKFCQACGQPYKPLRRGLCVRCAERLVYAARRAEKRRAKRATGDAA